MESIAHPFVQQTGTKKLNYLLMVNLNMRPIFLSRIIITIFLTVLGQGSYATEAPYYTWIDENGVVNFSQQNPTGVDARLITKEHRFGEKIIEKPSDEPVPVPPLVAPPESEDLNAEEKRIQEKFEKTMKEIAIAKRENCDRAKKNLTNYNNRGRIRLQDEDGEYRILTDEERQENINKFQNGIKENC